MHDLILWCGFLGAWLLVAGPIYQASQELAEEEFERDRYAERMHSLGDVERVSPWWWLLPPVHLVKSRRQKDRWNEEFLTSLDDDEYDAFNRYMNKAYGWILVAAGGLLIASKETFELVEGHEWPIAVFWVLVAVGLYASLSHAVIRVRRDAQGDERRRTARAARSAATAADN